MTLPEAITELLVPGAPSSEGDSHLLAALDSVMDGFYTLDADWRFATINAAAERFFRRSRAELRGMSVWDAFPRVLGTPFETLLRGVMAEGVPVRREMPSASFPGLFVEMRVAPLPQGGLTVTFTDVTDRKRTEAALQASEERLRLALEAAEIGMWEYDATSGHLEWDERTKALWGLPPDASVTYDTFLAGLHPDDRERTNAVVRAALDGPDKERFEAEYRVIDARSGVTRWIAAKGRVIPQKGRAPRFLGTVRDITAQKATEQSLLASEMRLRRLVEASPIGLVIGNVDGDLTFGNKAVQAMLGYTAEEFKTGQVRWAEITPPEWAAADARAVEQLVAHGVAQPYEKAYIAKDGRVVPILVGPAVLPVLGEAGVEVAAFVVDLTSLRQAESEAQNRRYQIERMTLASPDIHYVHDLVEGRTRLITDRVRDLLGYEAGEFLEAGPGLLFEIMHPDDREGVRAALGRMRAMSDDAVCETEYRLRRKNGAWVWFQSRDVVFERAPDGTVAAIMGTATPVTARKEAEDRQRLLVGELHHRIKNTLATVQAIAGSTMRSASTMEEFRQGFADRLVSLGRTHTLLTERGWGAVRLRTLLGLELEPYDDGRGRVVLSGPEVDLLPDLSVPLGMAFHELTTNASKYGALLVMGGHVEVDWEVVPTPEGQRLRIVWRERGGPPVSPPSRRGFGSQLLQRVLGAQLGGGVTTDYGADGVRVVIEAVLPPVG